MLVAILIIDIVLVAWSVRLMQSAVQNREFSLMFAGLLVASSAAAMAVVYFLIGSCMTHITEMSQHAYTYL